MRRTQSAALRAAAIIGSVAVGWWAAFTANAFLFAALEHTPRAHWIFLPAAVRVIAVLTLDEAGAAGLALGAWLTLRHAPGDAPHEIILALTSGVAPLAAITAGRAFLKIGADLQNLTARHIVALSCLCAAANALLLNGYLFAAGRLHNDWIQLATVFVGDITGAAIVLLALSIALSLWLPRNIELRR